MSAFDDLRGKAAGLRTKATDFIGQHQGQIQDGLDKAGNFADRKTGGKYAGRIDSVRRKASGFVENVDRSDASASQADHGTTPTDPAVKPDAPSATPSDPPTSREDGPDDTSGPPRG